MQSAKLWNRLPPRRETQPLLLVPITRGRIPHSIYIADIWVSSRSIMAESRQLLSLSHGAVQWKHCRRFRQMPKASLIESYDLPGIPLKPDLVSFSNLNPCPSNNRHKWTILVDLLTFEWVFLQVVQAKKGRYFDMHTAAGAGTALATARQTKKFHLWRHPFPTRLTSTLNARLVWSLSILIMEGSWALEGRCESPSTLCYSLLSVHRSGRGIKQRERRWTKNVVELCGWLRWIQNELHSSPVRMQTPENPPGRSACEISTGSYNLYTPRIGMTLPTVSMTEHMAGL